MLKLLLTRALRRWPTAVIVLTPLLLLPLIFHVGTSEARCAYVVLVVVVYWVTAVIPLAVTALLPVTLLPLLDVLPANKVAPNYMKETNLMLLTGVIMAVAIEHCRLHRRIALRILLSVGSSPIWLMLGFMITTAFLSMWLSNTATAAMMTPIVESIVHELKSVHRESMDMSVNPTLQATIQTIGNDVMSSQRPSIDIEPSPPQPDMTRCPKFRTCVLLSIAYAANLGGIGTMNGSGSNLVFMENLSTLFPDVDLGLSYATWMFFAVPCLIVIVFLAWVWLICYFVGPRTFFKKTSKETGLRIKMLIRSHYDTLGPTTFHEIVVLCLFILLVLLWIFRSPEFMPGWQSLFAANKGIRDSAAGVAVVFLLFVLPARADFFCDSSKDKSLDYPPPRALTWELAEQRVPWGVLLLMGGGYALADGFKESGLSKMLADQMLVLRDFPPWAIMTIASISTAMITEVVSNAATASVLLPVMASLADVIHVHPLYLMFPVTLCCSMAFMLPVATPVNAIVFRAAGVSTWTLMKPGLVMNVIGVAVILLFVNTLGVQVYHLYDYTASNSSLTRL